MAILEGVFGDAEATEPERIRVEGSKDELQRINKRVGRPPESYYTTQRIKGFSDGRPTVVEDDYSFGAPASRDLVRNIARVVEVQCDDQRVIDWMKQP